MKKKASIHFVYFKLERRIHRRHLSYFLYNQELLNLIEQLQRQMNNITSQISCMEDNANNTADTAEFPSLPEVAYGENPNFRCASAAIEMKNSPEKGRYVVANRDIKRGQILFVEKAFAFVPVPHVGTDICYNCCRTCDDISIP